jgi:hypothetical protein
MHQRAPEINSLCGGAILFLSCVALLAVLSGYTQPPQTDEGTGAHVFQLCIVALAPAILLFLATADWSRPLRTVRPLAFSAASLVLAFGALYYLEHYRDPHYGPHGRTAPAVRPSGSPGSAPYWRAITARISDSLSIISSPETSITTS